MLIKENKIKTKEEFKQLVRDVASMPTHPDIPTEAALTGRQVYVEFCYRMAKFDEEFKTLDPVLASAWLNTGMTRMIQEMQKRLFKAEQDIDVVTFFRGYLEEVELKITFENDNASRPTRYILDFNTQDEAHGNKYSTDPLKLYVKTSAVAIENPDTHTFNFPEYIPHETKYSSRLQQWYKQGVPFEIDYRELTEIEIQHKQFIVFNSFSSIGQFPPRAYMHKHNSGRITVYLDNFRLPQYAGADRRQEPRPLDSWILARAVQEIVKVNTLYDACKVDPMSLAIIKHPPTEFHHDIVDYAIDAYFESIFFQSFGKYSMKMARRDADIPGNVTSGGSLYKERLNSVPPTRYRLQHGAAAQA